MNRSEAELLLKKEFPFLTTNQLDKLYKYYEILVETSKVMNLTTITTLDGVYIKHFYDSMLLSKVVSLENKTLLDVGSGAGFPGIVIKIISPNTKVVLLEPTLKRCVFLQKVIDLLELKDITVVNKRAEEYINDSIESFDIVTARAVARLNILLELCISFVKIGGMFIPLKGPDAVKEICEAKAAEKILLLNSPKVIEFSLPISFDKRNIILYNKEKGTPKGYPRMYSKIKNSPL